MTTLKKFVQESSTPSFSGLGTQNLPNEENVNDNRMSHIDPYYKDREKTQMVHTGDKFTVVEL